MSVEKRTTTLYLRRDIVDRCRALNVNISETCNRILAVFLDRPGIHDEEIMLTILQSEKANLMKEIQGIENQLAERKLRMEAFDQKIEKQLSVVKEIQRSDTIAMTIRQLNEAIKSLEYDEDAIRTNCRELLEQLKELNIPVEGDWLLRQIERVKRLSHNL